jgi:beta-lactam-binding protein with PASTA domain
MSSRKIFASGEKLTRVLWCFGILLALFLLLNYVLLPMYVNHGSRHAVPRVVGLPFDQACSVLDSARLVGIQGETRPDPMYPAGVVTSQNPLPAAVVKEGRHVYLTLSGGEVLVGVPVLRGKSTRDARFSLERNGLKLGTITYDYSESFPENTIIEQSLRPDEKVAKGTSVGVMVSRGKADQEMVVPSLIGKTLTEGEKVLVAMGLKVGIVTSQPSFDLLPNTIVDQFPRPGENAKIGTEVDLFVVKVGKPTDEIQQPK